MKIKAKAPKPGVITTAAAALVGSCLFACIALSQAAPASAPQPTAAPAPAPVSANVQISFVTMPPTDATVTWGKKSLGRISSISPLVIVRPRDSGPLDVVVRADGFLPVQTRAHTFADTRITVKLTRPEETSTLLGYRVPVPVAADAGTPAPTPTTPATPAYDPNVSPIWNMNATPVWDMTAPQNAPPR